MTDRPMTSTTDSWARHPGAAGVPRRRRVGRAGAAVMALAVSLGTGSCRSGDLGAGPEHSGPKSPAFYATISNALPGAASLGTLGSVAGDEVAYVSLPPGAVALGVSARILNRRSGTVVQTVVINGGFDPVPVIARAGDTLRVEVQLQGTIGLVVAEFSVPPRRPPVIVRTQPPRGKRDVPLNVSLMVVFSEPIDPATVTPLAIHLVGGGAPVTGTAQIVAGSPWMVEFTPATPLEAEVNYELVVTQVLRDLDGEALAAEDRVPFTTVFKPVVVPPPPVPTTGYFIHLADPSGVHLGQLARGHGPTWSPDGTRIAFDGGEGASGGIYVMDLSGTAQRIRESGAHGAPFFWLPRWSPDGSKIAFGTCIPNAALTDMMACDVAFGTMNADGSGAQILAYSPGYGTGTLSSAVWSPDGTKLVIVRGVNDTGSRTDLFGVNADGSGLARLTQLGTVTGAVWSPNGQRLALRAAGAVYVINADGSALTQLTSAAYPLVVQSVEWSPQGNRIAFSLRL
ncbi:MAG: Ig-like domain-containing protein, partial [Gemmatimonadales bacterium]